MINLFKVAIYTDEAGSTLASSKSIISELNVPNVILRNVDNRNILKYDENKIRAILKEFLDFTIAGLSTDVRIDDMLSDDQILDLRKKIYLIKPVYVRFGWSGEKYSTEFVSRIIEMSIESNFIPVIEYEHTHFNSPKIIKAQDWVGLLSLSKRLRVNFDPVQYLMRVRTDPIETVFVPLRNQVSVIDVRDYKIGVGAKAIGYGSIDWAALLKRLYSDKYNGWLAIKPSLGIMHGDTLGREMVFTHAFSNFRETLEEACQ